MSADDDVRFLANALKRLLLSPEQVGDLLRSLETGNSASSLAIARGMLSPEQAKEASLEVIPEVCADDMPPRAAATDATAEYVPNAAEAASIAIVTNNPRRSGPPPPALEPTPRINDVPRFTLQSEEGRGGMGLVWRAHDEHVDRDVAVKEMLPGPERTPHRVQQFLLEAQVTGRLEHPGIVPIHELGLKPDGTPFYVMKLLKGRTLGQAIAEYHRLGHRDPKRPIAFNRLLDAFVDVCQAVSFAHSSDVLHRDLKPGNVMLGDFGEAVVVDWGLAKVLRSRRSSLGGAFSSPDESGGDTEIALSTAGSIKGTPAYMAPEQAAGENDNLTARTDIYALGSILYEILCGCMAFPIRDRRELRDAVCEGRFASPRHVRAEVPKALDAVCLKAMALRAEDRYASARTLGEEIERWRSGEPVSAYREPLYVRAGRWIRKNRTKCVSGATAVAFVVAGWALYRQLEATRIATLRTRATESLQLGRQGIMEDRLDDAAVQLAEAYAIAVGELRLTGELGEIEALKRTVDERVEERNARRDARDRLERFHSAYDDASYFSASAVGPNPEDNLTRCMDEALAALRLFGVDVHDSTPPRLDERYFSDEERADIVTKLRSLLVLHAVAYGHTPPGATTDDRASRTMDAVRFLDSAQRWGPPLRSLHLRRAALLRSVGRVIDADAAAKEAAKTPLIETDHFFLGEAAFAENRSVEAVAHLERALRSDPANFWTQYLLALCHMRLSNFEQAIALLDACQARRPEFAGVFLVRGFAHGERGELDAALDDFARAEEVDREKNALYELAMNRGVALLRNSRIDDAVVEFRRAMELKPKLAAPYVNLAEAHHAAKRTEEALAEIGRALEVEPDSTLAFRSQARMLNALDRLDESLVAWEAAIGREPAGSWALAQALTEKGRLLHRRKNFDGALKAYSRVLSERSDYVDALYLRALVLIDLNRDAEAITDLNAYIKHEDVFDAFRRPQSDARRTRQESEAKDDPTSLLQIDSKRLLAVLYRERGLSLLKIGEEQKALNDFAAASALIGDARTLPYEYDRNRFALMYSRRGWALLLHARQMAVDEFTAAIEAGRPNGEPYAGRGFAFTQLDRFPEAEADARKAVDLGPSHPEHFHNIACIYAQLAGKARADGAPDDMRKSSEKYVALAVGMMHKAIDLVAEEQRAAFLKHSLSDPALDPLRHERAFIELTRGKTQVP